MKVLFSFLMAVVLALNLVGCSSGNSLRNRFALRNEISKPKTDGTSQTQIVGQLSEVAPPSAIQQLSQSLEVYQPQIAITSPHADEVLQDTTVSVQFQVQDLPIFKDPDLGLGPHLHVILDNQPYQAVYDLSQPLVFENLPPGTHTLRVFASRPWHESFKNEGAYTQTTFHIFTKSSDNNPDPNLPLLTYSRPTGSYGAEPIMLDFYLTNAPLHLVARENPDDEIADWRIRVTINGESFVLDRWQPVYLKGFKPGKNWVRLEFLDEQGNPLKNVFNDTVRLIDYQPKGQDTLSKLVRGELSAEAARAIVNPNYQAEPTPTPTPIPSPETTLTPVPTPSPTEPPTPTPPVAPSIEETPTLEEPTAEPETPEAELAPTVKSAPPEANPTEQPKSGSGFFSRFRRPGATPSPAPELPEVQETPSPEPPVVPEEPEASLTPSEAPASLEETTPAPEETPTEYIPSEKPKSGGFLNRFRRPGATPSPAPELPEVQETPSPEPPVVLEEPATPSSDSELPPTLPEIVETPFPQPSEPEAVFPQPDSSTPTTPPEAAPSAESLSGQTLAGEETGTSELSNPEAVDVPSFPTGQEAAVELR